MTVLFPIPISEHSHQLGIVCPGMQLEPAGSLTVEVATALKQNVPVIPVLVENASMPRTADLPEDIRDLAFYNGIKLAPEFWRAGVERLIKELDPVMEA